MLKRKVAVAVGISDNAGAGGLYKFRSRKCGLRWRLLMGFIGQAQKNHQGGMLR
jgi:hypothetical protein